VSEAARRVLLLLLLTVAAVELGSGGSSPPIGPSRAEARCEVPVEEEGVGVRCVDPERARRDGLEAGDRIGAGGRRSRMAASRLALLDVPVSLNRATTDELASLDGIGPALAERIVAARPFASVDDVLRVTGIGPRRLASIRDRLRP
jgi:competence ComEA-like helix-hairpin-helix protein